MSSSDFKRDITVVSNNLGQDAKVLFAFDVLKTVGGDAYKTFFPVVWKVLNFPAAGTHSETLHYGSGAAWVLPVIKDGIVTDTSKNATVPLGWQTYLVTEGGETTFTRSAPYTDPTITKLTNQTSESQATGLAFIRPPNDPGNPVYVCHFPNVTAGDSVQSGIGHNCRAYIVNGSDYQDGEIITSPILDKYPQLWLQSLLNVPDPTTLHLTRDPATGKFSLS